MPLTVSVVLSLLLLAAGLARAVPGDNLADRIVIPNYESLSATTVGAGVEPGEINEAAGPAGAHDRSVWFEWQAPAREGRLILRAHFYGATSAKALAVYSPATSGDPVSMSTLLPAGFCPSEPGPRNPSLVLWHQPEERIIIRVWTNPAAGTQSDPGAVFGLFLGSYTQVRSEGDTPWSPRQFFPWELTVSAPERTLAVNIGGGYGLGARNSTNVSENLIGGQWYPAAAPFWYEWTAIRTERYRFGLGESDASDVRLLVASRRGNLLDLVAPPATATTFDAVAGEKYLLRISHISNNSPELMNVILYGGPAEPGDDPATAVLLPPGSLRTVRITGASPPLTPLPEDFLHPGGASPEYPPIAQLRPDVWFDLGSSLDGLFTLDAGGGVATIYRTDAAGLPVTRVAGGPLAQDCGFRAETGRRYLARVVWINVSDNQPPPWNVRLDAAAGAPPANDRRENALVLNTNQIPLVVRGNAAHATAEESDWSATSEAPLGRTVWYALDPPGPPDQPWFVYAWNTTTLPAQAFREVNGALVSAHYIGSPGDPYARFLHSGQRIWIRVSGIADDRFMLMAGPAVSPGDNFAEAINLTPGQVQYFYPGMATTEPDEPGQSANALSVWLKWTAAADGRVHFSTMGLASARRTRIFTGTALNTLTAVPANTYQAHDLEVPGRVESFEARAGVTYLFQTSALGFPPFAPFAVRIQPGGWESPWEVWRQNWPAWDGMASLDDPLADTDGDGILNLMEMALYGTLGPCIPDPVARRQPELWNDAASPPGGQVFWYERTYALRGPAGCTPFLLTGEASPDGIHWALVHKPTPPTTIVPWLYRTYQLRSFTSPLPANFFRLRVHR